MSKKKKQRKKTKLKKFRDWLAVLAHFRRSGPIKNKKKEKLKKYCRDRNKKRP